MTFKKGHKIKQTTRKKISNKLKGNKNCLGNKKTIQERKKISETRKRLFKEGKIKPSSSCFKKGHKPLYSPPIGKKHWFYNGGTKEKGISKREWNKLRNFILKRDDYTCKECGKKLNILIRSDGVIIPNLHIHHLDHNKKNNSIDNLITLCINCHRNVHKISKSKKS